MGWLDDIIKNSVIKAFNDPAIQDQARLAIIRVLDDKEVLDKLYALIDARIKEILSGSDPGPGPVPTQPPLPFGEPVVVFDLSLVPKQMADAGLGPSSDGAFWYALAHVALWGPEREMPDDGAGSMAVLNRQRDQVYAWFDNRIQVVQAILKADSKTTAIAITNDGPSPETPGERCGFRLGPIVVNRLSAFGDRVSLGAIVPESDYRQGGFMR